MKTRFIIIWLCYLLILFGCSPKERNAPDKGDVIAYFPEMEVGDLWVEEVDNEIVQLKVISVNQDKSFIIERKGSDSGATNNFYFDNRYVLKKIEPSNVRNTSIINRKYLSFPLFVGKSWQESITSTYGYSGLAKHFIEKFEQIQSKAGKINAFKILVKIRWDRITADNHEFEYWYSPQVKYFVKKNPLGTIKGDLIAYHHVGRTPSVDYYGGGKVVNVSDQPKPEEDGIRTNEAAEASGAAAYGKPVTVKSNTHWALVIGVSNYRDSRIPSLRYASDDSKAFYDWLVSPKGGKYAPSKVKLLTNEQATGAQIKHALFEWLREAIAEDVVLIYFAGHGSTESPDSLENLFLLPYDADYQNIASTAFPMWDIETALRRFIKAKKVIVITDACHAGGVGQAFDIARRAGRGLTVIPVSSALQSLSKISDGVCILSASDDSQFSQEGAQWGGGHGVFTFFLLEGLRGKADYNKDDIVTLGELIPFLSEQVRRETRNVQTPTVAGRFDPALSIAK